MKGKLCLAICTYNRSKQVTETLDCIKNNNQENIPCYVIDNSSDKRDILAISEWCTSNKEANFFYLREDKLGLSNARNKALNECDYDNIWFLDDDVIPNEGFFQELLNLSNMDTHLVKGGPVFPHFVEEPPSWLVSNEKCLNMLSCIDYGKTSRSLNKKEFLVGANFCLNKKAALSVGGFYDSLGRKGNHGLLSNEDTILVQKITSKFKENPFYCSKASVNHIIPKNRIQLAWFQKRMFWQAVSDILAGGRYEPSFDQISKKLELLPYSERNHRAFLMKQDDDFTELQLSMIYDLVFLLNNADEK